MRNDGSNYNSKRYYIRRESINYPFNSVRINSILNPLNSVPIHLFNANTKAHFMH